MTKLRNTPLAHERAQRRELRKLMAQVEAAAREMLVSAIAEGLVEGRIVDGEIIIDADELGPKA
jgi:hypothetical protein